MDCAICLNRIPRDAEAYLYPCFHFFCLKCIQEWTERQRQHKADSECPPGQPCILACPLCKQPYTYIVYDSIGSSCRLIPTCGQPKTMSAMPLSAEQSRRRALYSTPEQLKHTCQVVKGRRPRGPQDKETTAFLQRELQAVLLTQDVDIIVQHIKGVLQTLSKKHKPQAPKASNPDCSPMYGDKAAYLEAMSNSLAGFLDVHKQQFAEETWQFVHSGLTVAAYDKLVFDEAAPSSHAEDHDLDYSALEDEGASAGRDW